MPRAPIVRRAPRAALVLALCTAAGCTLLAGLDDHQHVMTDASVPSDGGALEAETAAPETDAGGTIGVPARTVLVRGESATPPATRLDVTVSEEARRLPEAEVRLVGTLVQAPPIGVTTAQSSVTLLLTAPNATPGAFENVTVELTSKGRIVDRKSVRVLIAGAPGVLDTSFGGGIAKETLNTGAANYAYRLLPDEAGGVIVGGMINATRPANPACAPNSQPSDIFLTRFKPDGQLDNQFAGAPVRAAPVGACADYLAGFVPLPGGAGFLVGLTADDGSGGRRVAIVKLLLEPARVTTEIVRTMKPGPTFNGLSRIADARDAGLVAVGTSTFGATSEPRDQRGALIRTLPDAAIDDTLGDGGALLEPFASTLFDVAVDATGAIYAVGTAPHATSPGSEFLVVRHRPEGTLDSTFGSNGQVRFADAFDAGFDAGPDAGPDKFFNEIRRVLPTAAGMLVVGDLFNLNNFEYAAIAVARLDPSGALDSTFGTGGRVVVPNVGRMLGAALQADGKLVIATQVGTRVLLARFAGNGSLDTEFGRAGYAVTDALGEIEYYGDVAVDAFGRILFTSNTFTPTDAGTGDKRVRFVARFWP